ncbi:MAG: TIGR03862 family flavoprotein [Rhodobacter sp.]|nr:TIGR03862 family flavoprotein [Rhodobacter sp.]
MQPDALVIGAGPAGLMAAAQLALPGIGVMVAEAKPSVGRKFLMAGKSGLNLTMDEPQDAFLRHFPAELHPMLRAFGPGDVQTWARDLGQEVFTGSSGRVFPKAMKASPLLRAWMGQLAAQGVTVRTRWRWTGWQGDALTFDTVDGPQALTPKVTVLALGGASWARLGSDGAWAPLLAARGVGTSPFLAANAGLRVDWSDHMRRHFGMPVKGAMLRAGKTTSRGEFVISERGLEGGGIYAISRAVRDGADLFVDLLPDRTPDQVAKRLAGPRGKATLANHLRTTLRLGPAQIALLMEFARPLPAGGTLARLIKALPLRHAGPRPLDEAISTAGGVRWDCVDQALMLRDVPGVFVAGEMLDWEAPTGGYLLSGCLATGRWAGLAARGRL